MLRVAICDDTPLCLEEIAINVESYFKSRHLPDYEISKFYCPSALLYDIEAGHDFDIVILDVLMPEALGTDTARIIRSKSPDTGIIFISTSRDYAVDAYDIGAVHYVTKPLGSEALDAAMDRAVYQKNDNPHKCLILHMRDGVMQSVDCDDIIFIESVGYRRIVHTKKGEFEEARKTLSSLLKELDVLYRGRFCIPYRGYIVNLDEISTIMPGRIVMRNGAEILIKKGDFRRIRDIYFSWTFSNTSS